MCGVLNHAKIMGACNGLDPVHLAGMAGEVNGHDGLRFRSDRLLDAIRAAIFRRIGGAIDQNGLGL